ncbi:YpdA family putative bacillithiol disulfide reductase [Rhodocytophaga aerolata]|uniref:YpdA family putative bacillithiol disulfide reductase n=1 Tax=Rhodocytophaga aerolata TaxID=455078 RepID=A0ABT8R7D0_9BACT|nr:YpdA family putative bacillithiol disulfide reductase [Rhodocytophaga aerolata]MDO1447088.1 YpdA family putative bacillithiol disulfide reductase [Rhodocytophaga aerolata]
MEILDIVVVGGGPCGLACAIEASRQKLTHIVLEKGSLTESIRKYPKRMKFFSTAENIEIGGIPFSTSNVKATRDEALQYYRKVVAYYKVNFRLFTEVTGIAKQGDVFEVHTRGDERFFAKNVVIATGYFDFPRILGIPGENLPHVSHYYDEPFKYSFTKVVIVGGGNSAIEAALELYRHDVDVTIVHKFEDFTPTAKYWLTPDLRNRIREGKVKVLFHTEIKAIEPGKILIENNQTHEPRELPADFVFLLVGYLPDAKLLKESGIELTPDTLVPTYDSQTFETNVKGLYLAGTIVAGIHTEKIFIENGREHAKAIVADIASKHSVTAEK